MKTGPIHHYEIIMEKGVCVKDIVPNARVNGLFVIAEASLAQSRNGPYWRLVLSDATGRIDAKIWSPLSLEYRHIPGGSVAAVAGAASVFKDELQLNIERFRLLSEDETSSVQLRELVPSSKRHPEEMFAELRAGALEELSWKPWRKLIISILDNAEIKASLLRMPGAKSIHHAFVGGLLEHTLGVFNLCRKFCDQYRELDRQTLLAGAILHDIGKTREFSGGIVNDYTDSGRLIGHMLLGLELIAPFLAKSSLEQPLQEHLRHLVLSHHGQAEYGAPIKPQTAEALALHYADNLDAKLAQCRSLFAGGEEPGAWSDWQRTLERPVFLAARTPAPTAIQRTEQRCLSLLKE